MVLLVVLLGFSNHETCTCDLHTYNTHNVHARDTIMSLLATISDWNIWNFFLKPASHLRHVMSRMRARVQPSAHRGLESSSSPLLTWVKYDVTRVGILGKCRVRLESDWVRPTLELKTLSQEPRPIVT
jgi:hypothetical protein